MGQRTGHTDFEALESSALGSVMVMMGARHGYTDLLARPPRIALTELLADLAVRRSRTRPRVPPLRTGIRTALRNREPVETAPIPLRRLRLPRPVGVERPHQRSLPGCAGANQPPGSQWNPPPLVLDGRTAGIQVAGRPGSGRSRPPRAPGQFPSPQPLRVHPTEPYAAWSPSQLGDWEISPGQRYVSRYRMVALDGLPDPRLLDRLWNDFAEPPVAQFE